MHTFVDGVGTVSVHWQYFPDLVVGKKSRGVEINKERPSAITTCRIELRPPEGNGYETLAIARAYCSPADQPNRVAGRKVALTRALQRLPDKLNTYEFRKTIWNSLWATGARR